VSATWCVLVVAGLGACGGGGGDAGDLPTPTRTLASPTRTLPDRTDTPTETEAPTEAPTETDQGEVTPTETEAAEPTSEAAPEPDAEPEPQSEPESEASETEDEAVSPWLWLLLALAVVAIVLTVVLVVRARRRGAWREQYDQAASEMAWIARTLLPQLRAAGSLDRMAGGWGVESPRVAAVEDRLTVLESSARNEEDGGRARVLRDAVRDARSRMDFLASPGPHEEWALDVDDVIARLEAALRSPQPPT